MFLSEWHEFPSAPCLAGNKKLVDTSHLDVVEILCVPDMLPSLFPSWSGKGLISTPVSIGVTCNLCPFKVSHIFTSPTPQIFVTSLWFPKLPAKLLALPRTYCSELACGLAPWFAHWHIRTQLCTVHWLLNLYKGCLITPTFICPEYDNWHVWWSIRKSSFIYIA